MSKSAGTISWAVWRWPRAAGSHFYPTIRRAVAVPVRLAPIGLRSGQSRATGSLIWQWPVARLPPFVRVIRSPCIGFARLPHLFDSMVDSLYRDCQKFAAGEIKKAVEDSFSRLEERLGRNLRRISCQSNSIYNGSVSCWAGWSLPVCGRRAQVRAAQAGRGKSELQRAVCRITSGGRPSRAVYGKCHRKYTASSNRGKGEKVR